MSQVGVYKPKKFLFAPLAALFCIPLSKRLGLRRPWFRRLVEYEYENIAPKLLAAPISVVWLYTWLGPNKLIFSSGRHFYLSPLAVQKVTTPLGDRTADCKFCDVIKQVPVAASAALLRLSRVTSSAAWSSWQRCCTCPGIWREGTDHTDVDRTVRLSSARSRSRTVLSLKRAQHTVHLTTGKIA